MSKELTPLCELAKKYGTDKGGWHLKAGDTCHNYTPTYHKLFSERRETVHNVLEIGIGYGCSLRMWEEYFPNATIIGLDNNPNNLINKGRIRSFHADQSDARTLGRALKDAGTTSYDLIVDDGSHDGVHQIYTAKWLLPCLAEEGLYVVEDVLYDCKPYLYVDCFHNGHWNIYRTGVGLGRAHCECGCGVGVSEVLLVGSKP